MGLTRKTMSLFTMGAVDFRSDKERTAAYTRGIRRQARKQTQILKQQSRIPEQRQDVREYVAGGPVRSGSATVCAVGPCDELRIDGTPYCAKHGPRADRAKRKARQIAKGKP